MYSPTRIALALVFTGAVAIPATAQTTANQNRMPTMGHAQAIRDHLDEAEDLVDSLLRWRHVTSWSDKGQLHAPPPEGPANTLISIEQAQVQRLTALLGALAAQLPAAQVDGPRLRGDLRAHLDKAQQIARELQPPHATVTPNAANAAGGLVTIDRTTLERLNVELDAMEQLVPRNTK